LQNPTLPQPELFEGAMENSDNRQSPLAANQILILTGRLPVFSKRYPGSSQVTVTAPHASPSHSLASGARPVDTSSGRARRTLLFGLTIGLLSAGGVSTAGVALRAAGGDAVAG
jgi:hypothetical protein